MTSRVMSLHMMVESIDAALAAPETQWERLDDLAPPTRHYTGAGHSVWAFQLLVSPEHPSIGTAFNVKEGVVVRLTDAQTHRAEARAQREALTLVRP